MQMSQNFKEEDDTEEREGRKEQRQQKTFLMVQFQLIPVQFNSIQS